MNTKDLLRELKYTRKKHENDKLQTFQTNIKAMLDEVIPKLEKYAELENRDIGAEVTVSDTSFIDSFFCEYDDGEEERYCGNCDNYLPPNSREKSFFCSHCGFRLVHPEDIDPEREMNEEIPTSNKMEITIKEFDKLFREHQSLTHQIDYLAEFIMNNIEGEPSRSEGAVETAVRLLKKYNAIREK